MKIKLRLKSEKDAERAQLALLEEQEKQNEADKQAIKAKVLELVSNTLDKAYSANAIQVSDECGFGTTFVLGSIYPEHTLNGRQTITIKINGGA